MKHNTYWYIQDFITEPYKVTDSVLNTHDSIRYHDLVRRHVITILYGPSKDKIISECSRKLWTANTKILVTARDPFYVYRADNERALLAARLNRHYDMDGDVNTNIIDLNYIFVDGYRSLKDQIYEHTIKEWPAWFKNKMRLLICTRYKKTVRELRQYCEDNELSYIIIPTEGFY